MARGRQRACDRRGFRLSCWCVFARTFISTCGIALGPLKSLRRVGEEVARRLLVGCLLAASKMLRNYPSVTLTRISSSLGWGMGIGKWEMGIGKWEMGIANWKMGNVKWEMGNGSSTTPFVERSLPFSDTPCRA